MYTINADSVLVLLGFLISSLLVSLYVVLYDLESHRKIQNLGIRLGTFVSLFNSLSWILAIIVLAVTAVLLIVQYLS